MSWPIRLDKAKTFEIGSLQEFPGEPSIQIRLRLGVVLNIGRLRLRTDERGFARNQPLCFCDIWVRCGETRDGDKPWRVEEAALVVVDSGLIDGTDVVHLCFSGAVLEDTEELEHLSIEKIAREKDVDRYHARGPLSDVGHSILCIWEVDDRQEG